MWRALAAWSVVLVAGSGAVAAPPAPNTGWQERAISALSVEEVDDLMNGRGMGMALPAELNGYPGPRHVLDLADELELSPDQVARTTSLFEEMRRTAIALGEEVVRQEVLLDELFASGAATEAALFDRTSVLGRLTGRLRAHHLGYHLAMRDLLEPHQVEAYQRLRGYAAPPRPAADHGHQGHH